MVSGRSGWRPLARVTAAACLSCRVSVPREIGRVERIRLTMVPLPPVASVTSTDSYGAGDPGDTSYPTPTVRSWLARPAAPPDRYRSGEPRCGVRSSWVRTGQAILLDAYDQRARPGDDPGHVHAVRRAGVPFHAVSSAPEKLRRPDWVSSPGVGGAYGELRQPSPQLTFDLRGGLPGALQYLVRLKRCARVEEALRFGERLVRRQREIVRDPFHSCVAIRQGSTQCVASAGVARAPGGTPITRTVTRWTHRFCAAAASRRLHDMTRNAPCPPPGPSPRANRHDATTEPLSANTITP